MAAGSGDTASKYVARRETPLYIAENCTQCMECIAVCPDTALPNCSQDLETCWDGGHQLRHRCRRAPEDARSLPEIEKRTRELMRDAVAKNARTPLQDIIREVTNVGRRLLAGGEERSSSTSSTKCRWRTRRPTRSSRRPRRRRPARGGVFSIFVSDLCKGCAACVTACGEHDALRMVQETEEVNAEHETGTAFLDLLPDTPQKYLGLYNDARPQDSKTATLRNMLMVRRNYDALVSGDGACAGCGEKSILRAIAAVTEAYMRPLYHAKADRFRAKADELEQEGVAEARGAEGAQPGGIRPAPPGRRAPAHGPRRRGRRGHQGAHRRARRRSPTRTSSARSRRSCARRRSTTRTSRPIDGRLANGMSVMAMAAHTGCNTVYGSTPPNNPHPYPWMNSLFQDGITVGWLLGESFIVDHGRRSVIPERLADALHAARRGRHQPARVSTNTSTSATR